MGKDKVSFEKLIKKLSEVDIKDWKYESSLHKKLGDDLRRSEYSTKLNNMFKVSLKATNYFEGVLDNPRDQDYELNIWQKWHLALVSFSGKKVKKFYNLIEDKYNKREKVKEVSSKEFVERLNEFLEQ